MQISTGPAGTLLLYVPTLQLPASLALSFGMDGSHPISLSSRSSRLWLGMLRWSWHGSFLLCGRLVGFNALTALGALHPRLYKISGMSIFKNLVLLPKWCGSNSVRHALLGPMLTLLETSGTMLALVVVEVVRRSVQRSRASCGSCCATFSMARKIMASRGEVGCTLVQVDTGYTPWACGLHFCLRAVDDSS